MCSDDAPVRVVPDLELELHRAHVGELAATAVAAVLSNRPHTRDALVAEVIDAGDSGTGALIASEVLGDFLLDGLPQGGLNPAFPIRPAFTPPSDADEREREAWHRAVLAATALLTGQAAADVALQNEGLRGLASAGTSAKVLVVLVHAAAEKAERLAAFTGEVWDGWDRHLIRESNGAGPDGLLF
ncbi:hypothetical protein [Umezawaea beigongshangensis]|uniref:hypothetical protein n=1 Tax=Umezawaea beigongshangensis TaxID=2780383 RepID=UPI0018F23183|nr:hypothetical protein [Umezawaea beigongshangensis]